MSTGQIYKKTSPAMEPLENSQNLLEPTAAERPTIIAHPLRRRAKRIHYGQPVTQ